MLVRVEECGNSAELKRFVGCLVSGSWDLVGCSGRMEGWECRCRGGGVERGGYEFLIELMGGGGMELDKELYCEVEFLFKIVFGIC